MPVRVLKQVGIDILIVMNASGGLNPDFKVGDPMIVKNHINFPGLVGLQPLRGPKDDWYVITIMRTGQEREAFV